MNRTNDNGIAAHNAANGSANPVAGRLSRAEAIADGVLIEVGDTFAREARFRVPVALSASAWAECVEWTEGGTQDEEGRLWGVLWMAVNAIRRKDRKTDTADFVVHRVAKGDTTPTPVHLKIVVGPGDDAKAVLTIYLTNED